MNLSQKEKIKSHLLQYGSITPLQALTHYGCFRLAVVIQRLRDKGMNIETDMSKENFAVYRLRQLELSL